MILSGWISSCSFLSACFASSSEAVVGVTRLLDDFEFTFENDGALPVRYDLTLNLDGVARCRVRARQAAAEI